MPEIIIIAATLGILIFLLIENFVAQSDRKKLSTVVYVNGTRGKSTVTRLIDAGLREAGYKVVCKTTGTVPMIIGVDNEEKPIRRTGRANIKEQLWVLHKAAGQNADILVCECMAVDPFLQRLSQEKMVRSNVGVITNVRLDHTEEMGKTTQEICDALSGTIPKGGMVFTADEKFYPQLCANAQKKDSRCVLAKVTEETPEFNFKENLELALGVCEHLGVDRYIAFKGMQKFKRDPYDLSVFRFPNGAVFINGMSINDPQSTQMVYDRLKETHNLHSEGLTLVVNNRRDRAYRTEHMISLVEGIKPARVWLLGAAQGAVKNRLQRQNKGLKVRQIKDIKELDFKQLGGEEVLFAVGNIANEGHLLMEKVKEEAVQIE